MIERPLLISTWGTSSLTSGASAHDRAWLTSPKGTATHSRRGDGDGAARPTGMGTVRDETSRRRGARAKPNRGTKSSPAKRRP